jgi:hypothetical protein
MLRSFYLKSSFSIIWIKIVVTYTVASTLPCYLQTTAFSVGKCWFMKRTISWDITLCSQLKVNHLLSCWYLAWLIQPWMWRRYVPLKWCPTSIGLHSIIFQKIVLFVTTFSLHACSSQLNVIDHDEHINNKSKKTKNSVAFSPQANYTDRATAACRRS